MIYIDKKATTENEMPRPGIAPGLEFRTMESRTEGRPERAGNIQIILFTEVDE